MDWSHNTHLNDVLVFMYYCMGNQHQQLLKHHNEWNDSHVNNIFKLNGSNVMSVKLPLITFDPFNLMSGNLTLCWFLLDQTVDNQIDRNIFTQYSLLRRKVMQITWKQFHVSTKMSYMIIAGLKHVLLCEFFVHVFGSGNRSPILMYFLHSMSLVVWCDNYVFHKLNENWPTTVCVLSVIIWPQHNSRITRRRSIRREQKMCNHKRR